jgi:hypothetical protein
LWCLSVWSGNFEVKIGKKVYKDGALFKKDKKVVSYRFYNSKICIRLAFCAKIASR